MLKVENLSLEKKKKKILQNLNCEVGLGQITVLLGKSGSGKSSLLRCMAQIECSYEGTISYFGSKINAMSSKQRAITVGFVPQSNALFPHMTALKNCAHPLEKNGGVTIEEAKVRATAILTKLDMGAFLNSFPHELSGGQQQRVAIGRALALNPLVLLLDEPTSALDGKNIDRLADLLTGLKLDGKGIVIATHDISFATKISDQVVWIKNFLQQEGHFG